MKMKTQEDRGRIKFQMMISSIMHNDYYDLFNDDEDQSHHDLNGQLI